MPKKRSRRDDGELRQPAGLPADSVVHELANFGRSTFGLELSRAMGEVRQADRVSEAIDERIRERMVWIRIKHDALAVVGGRVGDERDAVWKRVREANPSAVGSALLVGRTEVVTLTADLEALVILLRATLDGLVALVRAVERDVLGERPTSEGALRGLPSVAPALQRLVHQARNAFAHGQAAWPAVIYVGNKRLDLAISARLRPDYQAGEGYILLSQVIGWWRGLEKHLDELDHQLAARVRRLA